jgi:hypothetical protein
MQIQGVMITNGGKHSPEKWSMATAATLIWIDPTLDGPEAMAGEKLRIAIAEALIPHHTSVQERERAALTADAGACHASSRYSADEHVQAACEAVVGCVVGTQWEAAMTNAQAVANMVQIIQEHFASSRDIERGWHIDENGPPPAPLETVAQEA